jgi:heptosyltransferase-2/heptosyltransferase-3
VRIERVLIINIFGIGDVLFSTPLIRNVKKNYPHAVIGYIANSRTAPFLRNNPHVDQIFIYDRDEFHGLWQHSKRQYFQKGWQFFQAVKKGRFQVVFDLSLNGTFALLTGLAGIGQRVGYDYRKRSPWLTTKLSLTGYEGRHVVDYYCGLLETLGWRVFDRHLEWPHSQEDMAWAENFLQQHGLSQEKTIIALHPGGGASWGRDAVFKRWPAANYARLADKIIENLKTAIILMGDYSEIDLCQKITEQMRHHPVVTVGQTSLGQMAALLSRCRLAVVNDGGPLHIAVAAGIQTLAVFGPVDEKVYGPYPAAGHRVVSANVVCRPCYRQFRRARCEHISCIQGITVEQVLSQVTALLYK